MAAMVCFILPAKNWVSLGFTRGTSLPDPSHLLEGTGKNLRHVKLKKVEEVENPAVRKLLEAALEEMKVSQPEITATERL